MYSHVRVAAFSICAFATASVLPAQAAPGAVAQYAFGGTVKDPTGAPVAGAEVVRVGEGTTTWTVFTADDGTFSFGRLPAGVVVLRVRRLGFQVRQMELEVGTGLTNFDVTLKPVAAELAEVVLSTEGTRLHEFVEHRNNRGTFGRFVDQSEIQRRRPMYTSELFRSIPGISVRASNTTTGNTIRIRGCRPTLWVDGQRMPDTELDEVAAPSDIGGIAFFPSLAGVPPQYLDRMNRACGTIIVWTRSD